MMSHKRLPRILQHRRMMLVGMVLHVLRPQKERQWWRLERRMLGVRSDIKRKNEVVQI